MSEFPCRDCGEFHAAGACVPYEGRNPPAARKCGSCTLCCTLLGITALGKRPWVPCQFESRGCSIYADRPHECRTFRCGWLAGFGGLRDRPDKIGAVFAEMNPKTVAVYERSPGAADSPRVQALIRKLQRGGMKIGVTNKLSPLGLAKTVRP
jgi:hypothetical protein